MSPTDVTNPWMTWQLPDIKPKYLDINFKGLPGDWMIYSSGSHCVPVDWFLLGRVMFSLHQLAVNVFDIDLKAISVTWLEGVRLHNPLAPWVFLNATLKVWHRKLMYQFLSLRSSSQLAQHQTSLNLCKALRCWHFSMDPSSGWGWGIRTDQLSTSSIFTRDVGCCLCISWQF